MVPILITFEKVVEILYCVNLICRTLLEFEKKNYEKKKILFILDYKN